MGIETIQIEGFRSLKSVTWKPGSLNVLIGPNGGGKSNILRALDLLRVAASGGLRDAIVRLGGMAPLVWDGQARIIRFGVDHSDFQGKLRYRFEMERLGSTGGFEIASEVLTKFGTPEAGSAAGPVVILARPEGKPRTMFDRMSEAMLNPASPDELLLTASGIVQPPEAYIFQRLVKSWSIHHDIRVDQSAELRAAAVTRAEDRVEPDGQNLIAVLHTLYEGDRHFEEFVDGAMKAAFPDDYDKLTFPPADDGRTQMRLRRKHRKRADSASDLSDGTLRFLLLITILGSPDPAPLIAIDEPETGLHPRMLPIVAEVAANAAMKTQVIFTTHSPNLLDAFGDELPTTTIVTSNGSETELKTIGGEELTRWVKDYSLGRFAFSGEADAVL